MNFQIRFCALIKTRVFFLFTGNCCYFGRNHFLHDSCRFYYFGDVRSPSILRYGALISYKKRHILWVGERPLENFARCRFCKTYRNFTMCPSSNRFCVHRIPGTKLNSTILELLCNFPIIDFEVLISQIFL